MTEEQESALPAAPELAAALAEAIKAEPLLAAAVQGVIESHCDLQEVYRQEMPPSIGSRYLFAAQAARETAGLVALQALTLRGFTVTEERARLAVWGHVWELCGTPQKPKRDPEARVVITSADLRPSAAWLLQRHADIERQLADLIGGQPRSHSRLPLMIEGREYEALPGFLMEREAIGLAERAAEDLPHEADDGQARRVLRELAGTVLVRQDAERLMRDAPTRTAVQLALTDLVAIVERMAEKGAF